MSETTEMNRIGGKTLPYGSPSLAPKYWLLRLPLFMLSCRLFKTLSISLMNLPPTPAYSIILGWMLSLSRDFPDVFKKRRMYSSSSKVKSQLKHQSLSISGHSERRDCCKVFSTCSLNSSLKLCFSKCFPVKKISQNISAVSFSAKWNLSYFNNGESPASTLPVRSLLTRFQNSFEWLSLTPSMELLKK